MELVSAFHGRGDFGCVLYDQVPNLMGVPAREKKMRDCLGFCVAEWAEQILC